MWISCRKASELMSQQLERPLTFFQRVALAGHCAMCLCCGYYGDQIRVLHDIAPHLNENFSGNGRPMPVLAPEARSRIQLLLSGEAQQ